MKIIFLLLVILNINCFGQHENKKITIVENIFKNVEFKEFISETIKAGFESFLEQQPKLTEAFKEIYNQNESFEISDSVYKEIILSYAEMFSLKELLIIEKKSAVTKDVAELEKVDELFTTSLNIFLESVKSQIVNIEPIFISKSKIDPSSVSFENLVERKSINRKYSMLLPSNWNTSIIMYNKAGIQAIDKTFKLSIFILAVEKPTNLYPKEIATNEIRQSISDYKSSEIISDENKSINGLTYNYYYANGKYYELDQTTFIAIISSSKYYYKIKLWTDTKIFENNFDEIMKIMNSFKEY